MSDEGAEMDGMARAETDGMASRWRPRAKLALKALGMVLLLAFVVPFLIYAFPVLAGAEGSYVVLSGSMEPAISAGDVVFVYAVDPTTIEAGDVITYSREGTSIPTTHRVLEVIPTDDVPSGVLLTTAGDANEDPDQALVAGSAVFGVVPTFTLPFVGPVLLAVPYMGHVIQFANTPLGFIVLVGLPLGAFILNEVWTIARGGRRSESDELPSVDPVTPTEALGRADSAAEASSTQFHDGTAAAAPPGTEAPTDDAMMVDQTDLTVAVAILGIVTVYAVWVAYTMLEPWSVSAAVAAGGSFLYLAALRYRARSERGPNLVLSEDPAARSLPDGGELQGASGTSDDLAATIARAPVQPVTDLAELRGRLSDLAGEDSEWPALGVYVATDGVLYTYDGSESATTDTSTQGGEDNDE